MMIVAVGAALGDDGGILAIVRIFTERTLGIGVLQCGLALDERRGE
jgi:hypothetical protein